MAIKKLLWVDGLAAAVAGVAVLLLHNILSGLFGLGEQVLLTQAIITLVYSSYSTSLAINRVYSKKLIRILAIANFAYVAFCLVLFIFTFAGSTILGKIYLLAEAVFISVLAILELRRLKYLW